jgi:decaprenylphospho-beta-D-erythro-pentofuranosid-2-ulose 2-reductase
MTAEFKKGLLWTKPEAIAKNIINAVDKNKNEVYAPNFWIVIMSVIKIIPQYVFNKISL